MVSRQSRDTAAGADGKLRGTVAPRFCPALSRGGDTGVSRSRVVPDPFAKTLPARMTTRHEKERAKQIQEKCQNLLTQMLRDEDNKYCVDCDAKGLCLSLGRDMDAPIFASPFSRCPRLPRIPPALRLLRAVPSERSPLATRLDIDHGNNLCDASPSVATHRDVMDF